ncbi:30S ribosomal protein S18 [Campylobacter sp. 19-13652]|uniref:30S ribosomal protein S18 n=1 Tax=Campylobacter sp. 19-13652 TaxID=2840180 RepID=UPI001C781FE7|nr:30S ribosomal protein S18 [Campylobacter sp. 19-13652]BCX79499.1 30S ribosomal protein S18 [Campylobacter sp. 19-13652]
MAEKRKYSRKYCKYTEAKIDFIDYKDTALLKHCLSERFKIMPRRLTGTSKKYQEMVERAIKRARHAAIIPYVVSTNEVVANPFEGL